MWTVYKMRDDVFKSGKQLFFFKSDIKSILTIVYWTVKPCIWTWSERVHDPPRLLRFLYDFLSYELSVGVNVPPPLHFSSHLYLSFLEIT